MSENDRDSSAERVLPEGVIDAAPAGGWDGVDDAETAERSDAAASEQWADAGAAAPSRGNAEDVGAGTAPDVPIESDEPGQGSDPDLGLQEES